MPRSTVNCLALSVWLPLFSLLSYWLGVRCDHSTIQLSLIPDIAILGAAGLFLYAPIARKVERGSIVRGLLLTAAIALGAIGYISHAEPWGSPLFLFAIWAPVYHYLCRQEEGTKDNEDTCPHYQRGVSRIVQALGGKGQVYLFKLPQE